MSLPCNICEVMAARPTVVAPPDVVADWLDHKAKLLDAIAANPSTTPADATDATTWAESSRTRAAEWRARYGVAR